MTNYDKLLVNVCKDIDAAISSVAFGQRFIAKDSITNDSNFQLYISSLVCLRDRVDEALQRIEVE